MCYSIMIFIIDDISGSRTWFLAGLPHTTHLRVMWGLEAPVHKTGTPGPKAQDFYIAIRIGTYSILYALRPSGPY